MICPRCLLHGGRRSGAEVARGSTGHRRARTTDDGDESRCSPSPSRELVGPLFSYSLLQRPRTSVGVSAAATKPAWRNGRRVCGAERVRAARDLVDDLTSARTWRVHARAPSAPELAYLLERRRMLSSPARRESPANATSARAEGRPSGIHASGAPFSFWWFARGILAACSMGPVGEVCS